MAARGLLAVARPSSQIVEQTVEGEIGPHNPASLLRRHPNCSLFVDPDAGALLSGQRAMQTLSLE